MGNESGNIIQTPEETSDLLFSSWCLHLLNFFDFIRVNFNSFMANNDTQQLPRSNTEGAFIWIQAETILPQTLKQLQQVFYVTLLILGLDNHIINIYFDFLVHQIME